VRNVNKNYRVLNVSSLQCFEILSNKTDTYLIDVRTQPEWEFAGIPDLSIINKKIIFVSFLIYPHMDKNKDFEKEILNQRIKKNDHLYFICRSGQRSLNASELLINSGFYNCFNVVDGFEGELNSHRKRSLINGWKYNNLPWKQQ